MDGGESLGAERLFSPKLAVLRIAVGAVRGVADEPDHHHREVVDVGRLCYRSTLHIQGERLGEVAFDKGELRRGG